jgi:WD40 repeat protein
MTSALAMPGARVLLIGSSTHVDGSPLPSVAAVSRSVDALERAVVERCGVDESCVRVLHDPAGPQELGSAITEAANQAESVLLVYYVGHGLVGSRDGELYLATHATDSLTEGLAYKALPYSAVREALVRCRARSIVIVLDCCFSGRAGGTYGTAASDAFAASEMRGTHVLTSAAADEAALARPGDDYTAFTGELLRLLTEGDPTRPESLTLLDAYEWLDRTLPAKEFPRPRQHVSDSSGRLVLAPNPAAPVPTAVPAEPPADVPCPYRGMERYGAQDTRYFFGREHALDDLLQLITARDGPFVLIGPSGSGKSSLLHAGLIPAIEQGALPGATRCRVLTPGEHPVANLERHLGQDATVVIVDQFEELFTPDIGEEERAGFIDRLSTAGRVVLGLRADFYGRCMAYPSLVDALRDNTCLLAPMTDTELRNAIEKPARAAGLELEPGLTDVVLRDLRAGHAEFDAAGALPLLSYALLATWQRRAGVTMTLAGYQAGGGIWESVSRRAETTYDAFTPEVQETARRTLLRMVRIATDAEHTRRRVPTAELPPDTGEDPVRQVLDVFARDRLVTVDIDTVTITHESLLRAWPRLRQWIERDSADLVIHQQLNDAAERWARLDRDEGLLYRGRALTEAELWRDANEHGLTPLEREFLDASSAERRAAAEEAERQRASERKQNRRLRLLTIGLAGLVAVALVASVIAGLQTRTADQQRTAAQEQQRLATARLLVTQAEATRATDPQRALRLGIAADRIHSDSQTRASLVNTLTGTRYAGRLTGLTGDVKVTFSPAGGLLATSSEIHTRVRRDTSSGSEDGAAAPGSGGPAPSTSPSTPVYDTKIQAAVTLWTVPEFGVPRRTGGRILIDDARNPVMAFAPDGDVLVTPEEDENLLTLWDVSKPDRPVRRGSLDAGENVDIHAVAYSPDGSTLAVIEENSLALWDVSEPARPRRLGAVALTSRVDSVAFSPDGRYVATGNDDEVVLWDVSDPTQPRAVGAPLTARSPIAFSGKGSLLATHDKRAEDQNVFVLWDVSQPAAPKRVGTPLSGNNAAVAFAPDGRTVATTRFDGSATLWDISDPAAPSPIGDPLVGHTSFTTSVAFSPDGRRLVTGSADETAVLWDLTDVGRPVQWGEPIEHVDTVVFRPGQRPLVGGGDSGAVSLRELAAGTRPVELTRSVPGDVATLSPDGRLLAAGDGERTTLWDVSDPSHPARLGEVGPNSGMPGLFSPDGRLLITGDEDKSYLWDVSDPAHPVRRVTTLPAIIVLVAAFSPDSRTMAIANIYGDNATLWNLTDPAHPVERRTPLVPGSAANITSMTFDADGSTLVTGRSDGAILLWDVTNPDRPFRVGQPLVGPNDGSLLALDSKVSVTGMAFSPNGTLLAAANVQNTLMLWDITDANVAVKLGEPVPIPTKAALWVRFAPDGRTVATVSFDSTAVLWDVSGVVELQAHATDRACAITGEGLDETEWARHIPGLPYQKTCP